MKRATKKRLFIALVVILVIALFAVTAFADGAEEAEYVSSFYATAWSLLPPLVAIILALITKEVYSSL
ncbi:MAG: Na+/H+ antiporter NhaC family protein, partial [Oscillospiraceae bacterium]|nr:Na+/H+ antiporter NhaC family protein [Oscillospiraceae bacterium]